jgi:hypothetical protein
VLVETEGGIGVACGRVIEKPRRAVLEGLIEPLAEINRKGARILRP